MAMSNVPPSEGDWTVRIGQDDEEPGFYTLETRCESWITGGPATLRFEKPEDAVAFVSAIAPIRNEGEAARQLASGGYVETTGPSDVWRPVMYALYHSAGPKSGYLRSAFHADGGPDPVMVPYDPEMIVPEDCDVLLNAHESSDHKILVRLDGKDHQKKVIWHEVGWEANAMGYLSPFIKMKFEDLKRKRFELTTGPFRRQRDHVLLLPTEKGTLFLKDANTGRAPTKAAKMEGKKLLFADIPPALQTLMKDMVKKVYDKVEIEEAEMANQKLESFIKGEIELVDSEASSEMAKLLRLLT